jgi:hypothetical protein
VDALLAGVTLDDVTLLDQATKRPETLLTGMGTTLQVTSEHLPNSSPSASN